MADQQHQQRRCCQQSADHQFVGHGQVGEKIRKHRFQRPALKFLRNRLGLHLLPNRGHLIGKEFIHGGAVPVADIDDLFNLRVTPGGFPLGDRLPGNLQLRGKLLLGHFISAAHRLQPFSKRHGVPSSLNRITNLS